MVRLLFCLCFTLFSFCGFAQKVFLQGKITDQNGKPIEEVLVVADKTNLKAYSDQNGKYQLELPAQGAFELVFYVTGFTPKRQKISAKGTSVTVDVALEIAVNQLDEVNVKGKKNTEVDLITIDPRQIRYFPSAVGDFNKILATLPGVVSNSELSSAYSVRGGNFDENQVYVNDIQIYRPFLVPAGQQEGLSFINPNLVGSIDFQAGGWNAVYGDKLSSVLNVYYKKPQKFGGSVTTSLLGASASLEFGSKDGRFSAVVGGRYKNSKYLLNTLPVKGQYFPRFYDLQGYFSYDLTRKSSAVKNKTTLGLLVYYANNNYSSVPQTSEISFGTLDRPLNLKIAFDGTESMNYQTLQSGVNLNHLVTRHWRTKFIASVMKTREREYTDLEAGFRLCDATLDPNSGDPNACATLRGIGTNYNYSRNLLNASVISLENRNTWQISSKITAEAGVRYAHETINDKLAEYSFIDSSGFVNFTSHLFSKNNLESNRYNAYGQIAIEPDSVHKIVIGARLGYWNVNEQLLIGPRIQYYFTPFWEHIWKFKLAAGLYQQPPFYRELRDTNGVLVKNIKAQESWQFILGTDHEFKGWNRPFHLSINAYAKYLTSLIPYDIINQKIRYYPTVKGIGYATGVDFRLSGEFSKGDESWISLGVLSTKEDIEGDHKGFIRRPTDQRVTVGVYFQDHIPNHPSLKMYMNLVYGTGLPFGPPNEWNFRNSFSGAAYRRLDVGFSKLITFNNTGTRQSKYFQSVWIGLEVLNLLGINNTLSYIWVKDFSNNSYAVPLTLSQRFLNLKAVVYF